METFFVEFRKGVLDMKNKKLIFALSLLGTLVLSACGGGGENTTESTTPATTSGSGSNPSTSTVVPHTTHTENEYGFCSVCGAYLHEDRTLDVDNNTIYVGALKAGEKYFCRFHAKHNYHDVSREDSDEITDAELKGYALIGGELKEVNVDWHDGIHVASDELGPDLMVYLVLTPTKDLTADAWFCMSESHVYNEAGVCYGEGAFIPGMIPAQNDGTVPGVAYEDDGKVTYYRFSASYLAGHKFGISVYGDVFETEIDLYYVDSQYHEHQINEDTIIPDGIGSLYAVLAHTHKANIGGFAFEITAHTRAEHGFCPDCFNPIGTELTFDIPSDSTTIAEDRYFYYELPWAGSDLDLRLYCSWAVFDEDDPKAALRLFIYNIYTGFEEIDHEYDDGYQENFVVTDPGDAGFLFIEIISLEEDTTLLTFTICENS